MGSPSKQEPTQLRFLNHGLAILEPIHQKSIHYTSKERDLRLFHYKCLLIIDETIPVAIKLQGSHLQHGAQILMVFIIIKCFGILGIYNEIDCEQ